MCGNLPRNERKQNRSEKKAQRFQVCPLSSFLPFVAWAEALPNGVNICANSIKWICSYECDLHFVGEITLSHACQGSSCTRIEWQLPQSTHSTKKGGLRLLGEENIFLVLLIFVFRINFYDFRGKLPCFLLLSCCFSFAIWKLARETMRKVGARGAGNTHNAP